MTPGRFKPGWDIETSRTRRDTLSYRPRDSKISDEHERQGRRRAESAASRRRSDGEARGVIFRSEPSLEGAIPLSC